MDLEGTSNNILTTFCQKYLEITTILYVRNSAVGTDTRYKLDDACLLWGDGHGDTPGLL
jgi:hypothetical protein